MSSEENIVVADAKKLFRKEFQERRIGTPHLPPDPKERWGKAAERLRRLDPYRRARTIMVSPDRILHQVRLNVLSDQKRLILPTPGLQKGFVLLDGKDIPVPKRILAVHPYHSLSLGKRLHYGTSLKSKVDLVIDGAFAVGLDGSRMGDGKGHLDLQCAILNELDWTHPRACVIVLAQEDAIVPSLPMDTNDVEVHCIVTPWRTLKTSHNESLRAQVLWEKLSPKQIRRNDALFFLHKRN